MRRSPGHREGQEDCGHSVLLTSSSSRATITNEATSGFESPSWGLPGPQGWSLVSSSMRSVGASIAHAGLYRSPAPDRTFGQMLRICIMVMRCPVPCLECGTFTMNLDLGKDHQHLVCTRCEQVWCFKCIGRAEIKISAKWIEEQRQLAHRRHIAQLN